MATMSDVAPAMTDVQKARKTHRAAQGILARQRHTAPVQPPDPTTHNHTRHTQRCYGNTTVYYGIHERTKCIPGDSGVTNLIHDRRSCVDFTLEVRRMWLDVSTQA